jgi:type IV secretory pathway VirB3-like protein
MRAIKTISGICICGIGLMGVVGYTLLIITEGVSEFIMLIPAILLFIGIRLLTAKDKNPR